MAESEVKSAALWLGKLMVEELRYLGAITGKVEILKTELSTLAAFLTDTAVRSLRQNNVVRTTLLEAKNIAWDCEDVIERYILQVARHGYEDYEGCQLGSIMRWFCLLRKPVHVHEIHDKIDQLNARITALKSCIVSYGVSDRIVAAEINPTLSLGHQAESIREFFPHEREVAIGLESQLKELGDILLDSNDHRVIVICGMGGIGKSMLAREVYHLPTLRDGGGGGGGGSFEAFGWAAASQQLQPDRVFRTLLYSLVPENDQERRSRIEERIRADGARAALCQLMREVKCLVVIDDIWTWNDWARLQPAFPVDGATKSRILLTTRKEDILSGLDQTEVHLHPVKGLVETKSWELFEKTTFPGASCTDSTKRKLGQEMLQHCKGVPLAIVVLAKVLKRKQRIEQWIQMRDDISSQIKRGGAPNLYKEVYDVLQVSYDELPYHLKNCFLHLANFPEDYEMVAEKLYHLWVAEGIVSKEDPHDLEEDIAERYLNELVSRSMVQVVASTWVNGIERIEKCCLHDLMRDICMEIAKREGFVQIVNCNGPMLLNVDHLLMIPLAETSKRMRRIAVYPSDEEPHSSSPTSSSAKESRASNLRSLLLFVSNFEQRDENNCKKFIEAISIDFPLLRVLECENLQIKGELPKKVANLIHLKYLGLANTRVTKLPSSIETLHWLQTLDLRVEFSVLLLLPNVLWKMKQLKHVYFPSDKHGNARYSIEGSALLRLSGLCNLQTLIHIDLDTLEVEGRKMWKRLKIVSASCGTTEKAMDHLLQGSPSMKSCTIRLHARILNQNPTILSICEAMCYLDIHADPRDGYQINQPLCLEMFPQTLVCLHIWYVKLANDPLPVLEKLPSLAELGLYMCSDGQKMVCSASGFPELTDLVFSVLGSFSDWEAEQGALLKLKRLRIFNCPMNKIPDALPSSVNVVHDWEPVEELSSRVFWNL